MNNQLHDVECQPASGCLVAETEYPTNIEPSVNATKFKGYVDAFQCSNITENSDYSDVSSSASTKNAETNSLSSWSSSIILVNCISMGYILNPSGFAQAGLLLGAVCLAFVSIQSVLTGIFVLEACTRAEMLKTSIPFATFLRHRGIELEDLDQEEGANDVAVKTRRWLPRSHSLRVHDRTFELSELCRIFLGPWLRNLFTLTFAGDLYGITWTLAVVFGSSLSEHVPLGTGYDYEFYILIFGAVAVPISCLQFSVQVPIQIMFLLARTFMLLLMLGTLIAAFFADDAHFGKQPEPAQETPLANFSSIVTVLQLCVFSTAYQFAVPGITAETGDKSSMVSIIVRSVSYIYTTNLVLSILCAVYFGTTTQGSSNLNWLNYHGGTWDGEGDFTRSWWATAISSYIVLFAAVDGLAVYPLLAGSLGDILMSSSLEDDVHEKQENRKVRIGFRLLASVPQAVGSLFLTDLGFIAKVAGIFTLMSYTICPCLLSIQSHQAVQSASLPTITKYNNWFPSEITARILIFLACFLICGVFYDVYSSFTSPANTSVLEDDLF